MLLPNLAWNTSYCDWGFTWLSSVSPTQFWGDNYINSWQLPFVSFPTQHASVLPFDCIWSSCLQRCKVTHSKKKELKKWNKERRKRKKERKKERRKERKKEREGRKERKRGKEGKKERNKGRKKKEGRNKERKKETNKNVPVCLFIFH
jgi:hypothetical protein